MSSSVQLPLMLVMANRLAQFAARMSLLRFSNVLSHPGWESNQVDWVLAIRPAST